MRRLPFLLAFVLTAAPAAAQQSPHDSVQGAVRVVDVRGRTIEVTTAVGMALRVVRLRVPPETRISAAGAPLAFAQLRPGDIIRVSFGSRPGGSVAYAIERVGRMEAPPGGGQ
jgi:hypothetical protein